MHVENGNGNKMERCFNNGFLNRQVSPFHTGKGERVGSQVSLVAILVVERRK